MSTTAQGIAVPTPTEALDLVQYLAYGYVNSLDSIWSGSGGENRRRGDGIIFTPCGLARAASVFGWLQGLRHAGHPEDQVASLAIDFITQLDWLASYGGETGLGHAMLGVGWITRDVPTYRVKLYDDGSLHGFSVQWWQVIKTEEALASAINADRRVERFGHYKAPYAYAFNGGLIYHGPKSGENFTVNIGSRAWGIHT